MRVDVRSANPLRTLSNGFAEVDVLADAGAAEMGEVASP